MFCYVYVENHMQKYCQEGFFITYVELEHRSGEQDQAGASDFWHLIRLSMLAVLN